MTPRLKLPAYGKQLLAARRAGDHPLVVHLIYGERWREEPMCAWQCKGAAATRLPQARLREQTPEPRHSMVSAALCAPSRTTLRETEAGAHAKLCITPDDYAPGRFNFRLVAGLQVALFDQKGHVLDETDKVLDLVGEIASWSADVEIYCGADKSPAPAHLLAHASRNYAHYRDASRNHGWPRWWSSDIELMNEQRRNTWLAAALADPEEV